MYQQMPGMSEKSSSAYASDCSASRGMHGSMGEKRYGALGCCPVFVISIGSKPRGMAPAVFLFPEYIPYRLLQNLYILIGLEYNFISIRCLYE